MFWLKTGDLSTFEGVVILAAEHHERRASQTTHCHAHFFNLGDLDASYQGICVKYNYLVDIQSEYEMLRHLYAIAHNDGDSAPHIPQPLYFFHRGARRGYIVMEHVQQRKISEEELNVKIAEAVRWLHSKRPPEVETFGTIGPYPTYPYHVIFKHARAPLRLSTVVAVERYLNLAVPVASKIWRKQVSPISLVNDEMVLSQCDIIPDHFGVTQDGRPIIFGVATIQAMPLTLANLTLLCSRMSHYLFTQSERDEIQHSPTMESLCSVMKFFNTFNYFVPKELDKNGNVSVAICGGNSPAPIPSEQATDHGHCLSV